MSIIPKHVAIIADGNRRWAKERNKSPIEGHTAGAYAIKRIIRELQKQGVHTITIWIFSTENWKRASQQVAGLMRLFEKFADDYFNDALAKKTRIIHLGRKDRLPSSLRDKIKKFEVKTRKFKTKILNIGLDYGGHDELIRAIKKMKKSPSTIDNLSIDDVNNFLDTAGQPYPEPDLIIRTGGEMRSSGFMIWQGAYSEYFFLDKYLPDVIEEDVTKVLAEYRERQRRFGK